jgi:hypothetical protein
MDFTVEPVACAPAIEIVPAPALPAEIAGAVRRAEERIDADPRLFNGPQLIGVGCEPGRVLAYDGRYAHMLAIHDVGAGTPLGLGTIGVGVEVHDGSGRELWCLRAGTVLQGGTWCFGTTGGVVPGQDFRRAALGELLDELWIDEDALVSFAPKALVRGRFAAAYLIWRAVVRDGVEPRPNPEEVADVRWVSDPFAELEPVLPLGRELWELARQADAPLPSAGAAI